MPGCPNGAEADPAHAGEAIMIQVAAIGADAVEFISGWWPAMVGTTVLATMPITRLCEMNPDDPGSPTIDMVWADLAAGLIPSIQSPSGTLGWWVWNKATYALFQRYCRCTDTGLFPPSPIVPVPPTGVEPYPPGPDNQPQLHRIEHNQQTAGEGALTQYLGILGNHADLGDLAYRLRPNYAYATGPYLGERSDEGVVDLPGHFLSSAQVYVPDMAGVLARIVQLPLVYKQRGTLHPRYYGVGSIMWVGDQAGGTEVITRRDSIHYTTQYFPMPEYAAAFRLAWRFMPGARVQLYQVNRNVDGAVYSSPGYNDEAFAPLTYIHPPSGFEDPPFYPLPSTTSTGIERASPYRIASPP